ncbi:hypothetical protein F2Q70_00035186 [Brassica cretica]|uniref:Zinc finger GRF-type domain-containing protein n=1 Tax=Brassica cretica TaxID=69181 RepID=A0A8S9JUU5_BRACR|nr:hypothetical protein F2Q70_00035186 [Brassica cretica]
MELGGGSNNRRRSKAIAGSVLSFCGLPAKISQAWTDKNPGRRFYGCERYNWFDEEEAFGWQKEALIEVRNQIRKKDKIIAELKVTISELRSDLVKKEEAEKDIINSFLKR